MVLIMHNQTVHCYLFEYLFAQLQKEKYIVKVPDRGSVTENVFQQPVLRLSLMSAEKRPHWHMVGWFFLTAHVFIDSRFPKTRRGFRRQQELIDA